VASPYSEMVIARPSCRLSVRVVLVGVEIVMARFPCRRYRGFVFANSLRAS
jgi:hypothetical protein